MGSGREEATSWPIRWPREEQRRESPAQSGGLRQRETPARPRRQRGGWRSPRSSSTTRCQTPTAYPRRSRRRLPKSRRQRLRSRRPEGHSLVQYGGPQLGQEVGMVSTACGACGPQARLPVLKARSGLISGACRDARAKGTREQRRRMRLGRRPLPSKGASSSAFHRGVGPAPRQRWKDV